MIKLSRTRSLALIASLVSVAAAWAWLANSSEAAASTEGAAAKAALTISVTQAELSEWPSVLSANGNVTAWQEAIIGAEAGGLRLDEVLVNVGDQVRKGQLLARLQSDTLRADLAQTRASLAEAEALLGEASANAERARKLESSGAMSTQQITQFLTAEQTASARSTALQAKIKADELRLSQTEVRAPDDGSISARQATVGAVVQNGEPLFHLIRGNRLEWRAEVPSSELSRLKPGLTATIITASGAKVQGTLRMVAPTVDAQTRNGVAYVDIAQTQDAKAGMFARGEINLGSANVLTLPQSAVQMRDGFHYVYRVGKDNKLSQTKIVAGRRSGERIEVSSGIDALQRVASSGVGFLSDGDTVRIVDTPPTRVAANHAAN